MSVTFEFNGQEFLALNDGTVFACSPVVSFSENCETQEEADHPWEKLSAGGEKKQCG